MDSAILHIPKNGVLARRKRCSGELKAPMKAISPLKQKAGIAAR